jgi:hypothetical protein
LALALTVQWEAPLDAAHTFIARDHDRDMHAWSTAPAGDPEPITACEVQQKRVPAVQAIERPSHEHAHNRRLPRRGPVGRASRSARSWPHFGWIVHL